MMVRAGRAKRGEARPNGNPAPTNWGPIQYTGHLWLSEIEVYYAKNRMYDPRLMRFLTTDPIGVSGGMNIYAYVGGDPVNYVDPLGLEPQDRILVKGTRPSCPIGAICDSDDIGRFMDQFTSVDQLISPDLMELIGDVAGGEESSGDGERECDETSLPSDEMGPEQRMSWIGGPLNSYLDSRTELAYWNHYKTGSGLDVRMGSAEFGRAASYAENVLAEAGRGQHGRGTIGVSFYGNAEFNGVLGSATVEYSNGFVIGIYDFYNFDPKSLGDRPSPTHEIATRLGRLAAGPNQEPFSIRGGLWSCP
jgi:RHS repeat-associated protein